jgi:hypothetical protein
LASSRSISPRRRSAAVLGNLFTPAERALVSRLRTPYAVERWLRALPYNYEKDGETLRPFRQVVRDRTAHCLEAALFAAAVLEPHGFPPLLMSLESQDNLDHVIYVFREDGHFGAVGRSRDPGLHGRKPLFGTPRQLARSYMDTMVDRTGRLLGFALADLRELGSYDWRFSARNVRKVERWLVDYPHETLHMPEGRYREWHARYLRHLERYGRKPVYYDNRHTWL